MDIYEKLNDRYAELANAGYNLDDGTRNDIVAEYQSRWDDGESFVNLSAMDMFLGGKPIPRKSLPLVLTSWRSVSRPRWSSSGQAGTTEPR